MQGAAKRSGPERRNRHEGKIARGSLAVSRILPSAAAPIFLDLNFVYQQFVILKFENHHIIRALLHKSSEIR
ncbi:MAG: hypothetical protein VB140_06085 [Burkholderia sp.]